MQKSRNLNRSKTFSFGPNNASFGHNRFPPELFRMRYILWSNFRYNPNPYYSPNPYSYVKTDLRFGFPVSWNPQIHSYFNSTTFLRPRNLSPKMSKIRTLQTRISGQPEPNPTKPIPFDIAFTRRIDWAYFRCDCSKKIFVRDFCQPVRLPGMGITKNRLRQKMWANPIQFPTLYC